MHVADKTRSPLRSLAECAGARTAPAWHDTDAAVHTRALSRELLEPFVSHNKAGVTAVASLMTLLLAGSVRAQSADFDVNVTVDAARVEGEAKPVWRFFGADEPNYATMKDGRTTLATLGSLCLL